MSSSKQHPSVFRGIRSCHPCVVKNKKKSGLPGLWRCLCCSLGALPMPRPDGSPLRETPNSRPWTRSRLTFFPCRATGTIAQWTCGSAARPCVQAGKVCLTAPTPHKLFLTVPSKLHATNGWRSTCCPCGPGRSTQQRAMQPMNCGPCCL